MSESQTSPLEMSKDWPLNAIATNLGRARCRHPAREQHLKRSLIAHGQLTPLVAVQRKELELIDGFKRLAAAKALGWPTLLVTTRPFDEAGQWVAMVILNP